MDEKKAQLEIIQLSIYCDIIMAILKYKNKLSINKIITFSFLIKKNKYYEKDVFSAHNKKYLVAKSLSLLSGLRDDYYDNICYIIEAIDLLNCTEKIKVNNDMIYLNDPLYRNDTKISMFLKKSIDASDIFTDRQFLKEVINNV